VCNEHVDENQNTLIHGSTLVDAVRSPIHSPKTASKNMVPILWHPLVGGTQVSYELVEEANDG
jgi:hypothetical protein